MNMGSNPSSATYWWANPGTLPIQYETRLPLRYPVGGMMMLPPHTVVRRLKCERGTWLGMGLSLLEVLIGCHLLSLLLDVVKRPEWHAGFYLRAGLLKNADPKRTQRTLPRSTHVPPWFCTDELLPVCVGKMCLFCFCCQPPSCGTC